MYSIDQYIRDWFIKLNVDKIPLSFYIIRKSLLIAVTELKNEVKGNVLDLACGVLPYKEYLMNANIKSYVGLDLEPTEYHNSVKPDFYWDGKTIPLPDESVDYVIATEFLEHYFETALILREINRVLSKGGVFFFTAPAAWPIHEAPYDYHRFTPFCLDEHFKRAEFSSWRIKPLGGFHYNVALTMALWNDYKLSQKNKKRIKPILRFFISYLLRKDDQNFPFKNEQMYSGLYGFVTK